MRQKRKIDGQRLITTYNFCHNAAYHALEEAQRTTEGSFYNCMVAMVFCAFTLEAYLNHLGRVKLAIPSWDTQEQWENPRPKLDLLLSSLGKTVDFRKRPYETFSRIFRFRNALAHGKTETLKYKSPQKLLPEERPRDPETKWQKTCTVKNARIWFDDTTRIIEDLHKHAGLRGSPLGCLEIGEFSLEYG